MRSIYMSYSQYCYHNQAFTLSIKSFVAGLHSKGHCSHTKIPLVTGSQPGAPACSRVFSQDGLTRTAQPVWE